MVRAAYTLFCANGYVGTTMNAIAAEADMAVQTLYYTFHNKAELLGEALGAAIAGFDEWRKPPPEPIVTDELLALHGWWDDFTGQTTSDRALASFLEPGSRILERVAPLIAAMNGGFGDPDAEAILRTAENRRVDTYRTAIAVIAAKPGGLRAGLDESTATDILVALFSAETYRALAHGRGWSNQRCRAFFEDVLTHQLLEPAG